MSHQPSQIREKVQFLTKVFTESPDAARVKEPAATSIWKGGLAVQTKTPNGATIETDMPGAIGGGETAPTPGWLLDAAVASCAATVIAMRAASQGVTLTKIEVSCAADADVRGMLGVGTDTAPRLSRLSLTVRIASDEANDEVLREIVRWACAHSPLIDTIKSPVPLDVELVASA